MGKIVDGIYYDSKGNPSHKGVVKQDDNYYYAGKGGVIVKDQKQTVHHGMANGYIHHGTYKIDKNGVIILSSLKKNKKKKSDPSVKVPNQGFPKYGWLIIALTVVLLVVVIILLSTADKQLGDSAPSAETGKVANGEISVSVPEFEDEVWLCSPAMRKYYEGEITLAEALDAKGGLYSPFVFEYTIENAKSAELKIGERADLSDGESYELDLKSDVISIDNLKTGTKYYFQVAAVDGSGQSHYQTGSFKTAQTNRFISLPGVKNVRDIGGYDTIYGKRVKEGLLVRGTELDGLVEAKYYLTDATALKPFGFVYDFDLRNSSIISTSYVSRLGRDVGHKFYNSPQYGQMLAQTSTKTVKQIFTDLCDPANYPMYFHCTYGTDRTGTIVFLLQGLLGVSDEDMKTEYKLSGSSAADGSNLNPIYSGLEGVPGDTINEKIENYMIDTVGITEEQIKTLRSIFLEDD